MCEPLKAPGFLANVCLRVTASLRVTLEA